MVVLRWTRGELLMVAVVWASGMAPGGWALSLAPLSQLQSGSDLRSPDFPEDGAFRVGRCFGRWLQAEEAVQKPRVAVGQDSRLNGDALVQALCWGLRDAKVEPVLVGLATTPAMFASCFLDEKAYDASVMVTASHLPTEWNGMKLFTKGGGLGAAALAGVLGLDKTMEPAMWDTKAEKDAFPRDAFMARYAEDMIARMRDFATEANLDSQKPFQGLKVALNAGNGAGSVVAEILDALGADISGSVHLEPDGTFPAHIPNPEDKVMVAETLRAVKASQADVGVMLDTDVDRSGLICGKMLEPLNRNRLVAAAAQMVLRRHPGGTIVTDSVTSLGLADFIAAKGGKHLRFMKGYRNVIDKAIALNEGGVDAPLAIETSGHAALKTNMWMDDGGFLAICLILELARLRAASPDDPSVCLFSLVDGLREPVESEEFRMTCEDNGARAEAAAELERRIAAVAETGDAGWEIEAPNYEGVRVRVGPGWFSVRESLHEPMVIVNAEAEEAGGIKAFMRVLHERCLKPCATKIDTGCVTSFTAG